MFHSHLYGFGLKSRIKIIKYIFFINNKYN